MSQDSGSSRTAFRILGAVSFCHLLNDTMQSLITAIYPILKESYKLDFSQIGLITLTFQITASILQPAVGMYTDKKAQPYSLPVGMTFTLIGLILLSMAPGFAAILFAVALVGVGSAVFHPESSRVARMASGGQHGLAQSLFQVGGNAGSSLGPLLAAFIVLPAGQGSIAWFSSWRFWESSSCRASAPGTSGKARDWRRPESGPQAAPRQSFRAPEYSAPPAS